MNDITFYQRFEADILAGRKTITIRDKSESHFKAGDILRVGRFEDNQYFCTIEVLSISPITLDELTEQHAAQANMGLAELKEVIREIYPDENRLYILEFKLNKNRVFIVPIANLTMEYPLLISKFSLISFEAYHYLNYRIDVSDFSTDEHEKYKNRVFISC